MKAVFLIVLSCITMYRSAAQDNLYGYYSVLGLRPSGNPEAPLSGCQSLQFNTASNTPAIVSSPVTGRVINYIGINKSGFLYGIEGVFNQGYNVIAYDTKNNYNAAIVKTNAYWDGGIGSDARTSGVAVDNNDKAWVIGYSVINGNNYLASFQTHNAAPVSNFSEKPFILKTVLSSFQVTDIVFDRFGNMYALALDLIQGHQYICFAHAKTMADTPPGGTIMLTNTWQITDAGNAPTVYNPNFNQSSNDSYIAEGLAFSSNGHLLISIDKLTLTNASGQLRGTASNYIYALKFSDIGSAVIKRSIVAGPTESTAALSYCDDLASNYYPVFLPLTYGNVTATIQNNQLQVTWNTQTERSVAKFNVSISKDGVAFTKAGSVNTRSSDGNANSELQYSYHYNLSDLPQGFFLPLALILFALGTAFKNQKRCIIPAAMLLISVWGFYACSKNKDNDSRPYSGKLFVKIDAEDATGNTLSSTKVVQVAN